MTDAKSPKPKYPGQKSGPGKQHKQYGRPGAPNRGPHGAERRHTGFSSDKSTGQAPSAAAGMRPRRPPRKISRISRLLSEAGLRLQKGLGQNFLVNQGALEKIAASIEATKETLIVEIGSGLGNLTELLASKAAKVVAIELDERFQSLHQRELGSLENLIFLYADFMELSLRDVVTPFPEKDIRVIGNIPYHLTSPILFKLMASVVPISKICLLMQREVGQRIVALPGTKEYGILAIKIQTRFEAHMEFTISPGSFLPPPKVYSSLVCFTPRADGPLITDPEERQAFFHFIDACFAQRRKLLAKSLEAGSRGLISREKTEIALDAASIDRSSRAEVLSVGQLLSLFHALGNPQLPAIRKNYAEK